MNNYFNALTFFFFGIFFISPSIFLVLAYLKIAYSVYYD